jgi:hypothetical protein
MKEMINMFKRKRKVPEERIAELERQLNFYRQQRDYYSEQFNKLIDHDVDKAEFALRMEECYANFAIIISDMLKDAKTYN